MREFKAGTLTVDVAIIGAGPAGLTAGYLLAKAGKSVAIVEKDETCVGGISRTFEREGYRFDIGGQRFFSTSQAVVDLWNELLPGDMIERPRVSRVYHQGKLYSYPPRAFEALTNLGLLRAARCVLSYLRYKAMPLREVKCFENWATNRFGYKLHSIFFKPYAEKVWGMSCDEISADWGAQRFERLSLRGAMAGGLKRSFGLDKEPDGGPAAWAPQETFRYPRLGPGMMWDAARDRIVEMGGTVLMGRALDQLASDGEGGWRLSAKGPDGLVVVRAAHAVSSAPLRELAARLHPLPGTTWNASQLKYRDFLTVALKIRPHALVPGDRIYVHDSKVKVGWVQNFAAWSPAMVPGEWAACLGLGYFCSAGDGLWSMDDDGLVALATKEMDILGLVSPDKVIGGAVVRQDKAYPVYDEEYAGNVDALRRELEEKHPTLHLVGRNGMHRCDNLGETMMSAMRTAENILAGERRRDPWPVEGDAEYREADSAGVGVALPARGARSGRKAA